MSDHPTLGRTRLEVVTTKVPTDFASVYTHVEIDDDGRVREVRISVPGKRSDSQVDQLLQDIAKAITESLP